MIFSSGGYNKKGMTTRKKVPMKKKRQIKEARAWEEVETPVGESMESSGTEKFHAFQAWDDETVHITFESQEELCEFLKKDYPSVKDLDDAFETGELRIVYGSQVRIAAKFVVHEYKVM